ncbi:MAG TPA: hypothetical protein PL188_08810 [Candidatus Cloacimonadota bacterium]|nr:hypothetical protein [Candidatus Cloacimonadota bacterium]
MKIENMKSVPKNREEFERNFNILEESSRQGTFHIANHLSRSIQGITNVRLLPNGRIDFNTVDENARLMANMTANMEHLKNVNE